MLIVAEEAQSALEAKGPLVALESSLISHGLPWPKNLETALAAMEAVRRGGAIPATIAVIEGQAIVGLSRAQIEVLARGNGVVKASRRDLGIVTAQRATAGTTVAATIAIAHQAGIRYFATGGIGGVHPGVEHHLDISADLVEMARTPVAVVCSGAKNLLDLSKTLEMIETLGVAMLGFGVDRFPAFVVRDSGLPMAHQVDQPAAAAQAIRAHFEFSSTSIIVAQPCPEEWALASGEFSTALAEATRRTEGVRGAARTPAILAALAELTGGRTLSANQALITANARLAAEIAFAAINP